MSPQINFLEQGQSNEKTETSETIPQRVENAANATEMRTRATQLLQSDCKTQAGGTNHSGLDVLEMRSSHLPADTGERVACSDFVTEFRVRNLPDSAGAQYALNFASDQERSESKALPLGFLLRGPKSDDPVHRVVAYLIQQEAHERRAGRIHFAEDLRQSQIAVLRWQRGDFPTFWECFVSASYAMYGTHPEQVFPKILAQRKAKLGREYAKWYDPAGNLRPDVPKKPSRGERGVESKEAEA